MKTKVVVALGILSRGEFVTPALIAGGVFAAFRWGPLGGRRSPETAERPAVSAGESSQWNEAAKKTHPPRPTRKVSSPQ